MFVSPYVIQVVQRGIGHSPEDITAALSSSDKQKASEMKETLKHFQRFLVNFEVICVWLLVVNLCLAEKWNSFSIIEVRCTLKACISLWELWLIFLEDWLACLLFHCPACFCLGYNAFRAKWNLSCSSRSWDEPRMPCFWCMVANEKTEASSFHSNTVTTLHGSHWYFAMIHVPWS